jgi:hypothetical protein
MDDCKSTAKTRTESQHASGSASTRHPTGANGDRSCHDGVRTARARGGVVKKCVTGTPCVRVRLHSLASTTRSEGRNRARRAGALRRRELPTREAAWSVASVNGTHDWREKTNSRPYSCRRRGRYRRRPPSAVRRRRGWRVAARLATWLFSHVLYNVQCSAGSRLIWCVCARARAQGRQSLERLKRLPIEARRSVLRSRARP